MKTEIITLADIEARTRIKKDIETNLIVEAGAGSGKTTEMSNRIVALLESGYRNINEIAAITFTNKAANELQHRVHSRLEAVYEENSSEIIRVALDNYHNCFIGTIHSFCGKMLRERPIEASVDPEFVEIDEAEDLAIRDKIWEDYVFSADDEGEQLLDVLNLLNIKVAALKNFLRTVCDNQDVEFNLGYDNAISIEIIGDEVNRVFDALAEFMQFAKQDLPEGITLSSDGLDGMQKSILMFLQKTSNRDNLSMQEKIKLLSRYTTASSSKVTQKCWSSDKELKKRAKEIGIEMGELRANTIMPLFSSIKEYAYNKVFIPFVEKTKSYYIQYKKKTGKMNFQDLLISTNNMLKDSKEARIHFQEKYKTLLVDEFQDTDPIQAQILMYLTGKELEEKQWDKLTPYPGSLFVVGDPKQSIYAFRRADIEVYDKFKQLLIEKGGAQVELTTNFRASKELGTWYNDTFSNIFNSDTENEILDRMQASFSDLNAINSTLENTLSGVFSKKIDQKKKADIQLLEIESIVELLNNLVGKKEITTCRLSNENESIKLVYDTRKIKYSDIMVLTMKKSQLSHLAGNLSVIGIPVRAVGANVIENASTFRQIANVVKMLAYPEQNGYLYQVMVNEPFNFSDDQLSLYRQLGGWISIHHNIEQMIEDNEKIVENCTLLESIKECFDILSELTKHSKVLPSSALFEKIAEELGLQQNMIKYIEMNTEISGYLSLLEQLRHKEVENIWGLDAFMTVLNNMIENGLEEEVDIQGVDYDAIRIMNVHKSKGLEAPIIILAGSYSGSFPNPSLYIERPSIGEDETYFKGHIAINTNPDIQYNRDRILSNHWTEVEEICTVKHQLEFDRLIYVAATRARNALIIFNSDNKVDPWEKIGSNIENSVDEIENLTVDSNPVIIDKSNEEQIVELANTDDFGVSITGIEKNRDMAFNANIATYRVLLPSKSEPSYSQAFDHDIEKKIEGFEIVSIDKTISETTDDEILATVFGTSIHNLFEALVKDDISLDDLLIQLSANYVDSNLMIEVFRAARKRFIDSKLYTRIQNAEEVHCEVPFAFKQEKQESDTTTYISGTIDLVFKENGKWVIVDYKTCNHNHDKKELFRKYKGQLDIYEEAWKTCTGQSVSASELFFVEK